MNGQLAYSRLLTPGAMQIIRRALLRAAAGGQSSAGQGTGRSAEDWQSKQVLSHLRRHLQLWVLRGKRQRGWAVNEPTAISLSYFSFLATVTSYKADYKFQLLSTALGSL